MARALTTRALTVLVMSAAALVLLVTPAMAQLRPLPPVPSNDWPADAVPTTYSVPAQPVSTIYPSEIIPPPSLEAFQATQAQESQPLPAHPPIGKDGFLQQIAFQGTYLPQFDEKTGLGVTDLEASATVGLPFPTRDSPLLITPYFAAHYFSWPQNKINYQYPVYSYWGYYYSFAAPAEDLPETLYDAQVEFRWLKKWNDRWGTDISATPGLHSDFETTVNAFRIRLQVVAAYDWTPQSKAILGIAYLDRDDVNWLPIAGVIWTPNDDTRWEVVFPRPKLARRLGWDGRVETWWYVAGELGGDQWAFVQDSENTNIVTTRDVRAMLGLERKVVGGPTTRFEIGYVFAREVEFRHSYPDFEPSTTMMARVAIAF